jgi:membrane protein CcdC involved in cytochrome C biogenesis
LFIVLFLAGSLLMIVITRLGYRQIAVTGVSSSVMLIYAAYVFFIPGYRVRADNVGDTLYYLGVLFTIVNLAYSLYEFRGGEAGIQRVAANLGIALATTIFGLMLRVVYHQLREDFGDREQETRVTLSQATSERRSVLLGPASDFNSLRVAVGQIASDAADTQKKLQAITDQAELMANGQSRLESILRDLQAIVGTVTDNLAREALVFQALERFMKSAGEATKQLAVAVEGFRKEAEERRREELQARGNIFDKRMAEQFEKLLAEHESLATARQFRDGSTQTEVPRDVIIDNVHFTLTGPRVLAPSTAHELEFWVHVEQQRSSVLAAASGFHGRPPLDMAVKSEVT